MKHSEPYEYNPDMEPQTMTLYGEAAKMFGDLESGKPETFDITVLKKGYETDVTEKGKPTHRCTVLITKIEGKNLKQSDSLKKVLQKTAMEMGVKTEKGMMEEED